MVTIIARIDDLEQLLGQCLPRDPTELNELLYSVKCEMAHPIIEDRAVKEDDLIPDDAELQIENVDTNRPDTWSSEGIARALKGQLGIEVGLRKYPLAKRPALDIWVDRQLREIRPFIGCVIARHPKINDTIIRGLIHLQEKLDQSYGRRRRRSSIGLYDLDLITPPLRYGVAAADEIRFVPLEWNQSLTLREILEKHPKGLEYGHIVRQYDKMPIILDSKGKVLSFPPIINSNDLGRLTPDTRNILVEVTGTSEETVMNCLTILTTALADRHAAVYPSLVHYPYRKTRTVMTPDLKERHVKVSIDDIQCLIGMDLSKSEIARLLRRARYSVADSNRGRSLTVVVPCYRLDILHPVDIIEDIAISYGLNKMKTKWPSEATTGGLSAMEEFSDTVRMLMIGLGFQEVLTFIMSNPEKLFTTMNIPPTQTVEVSNPKIATLTCLRGWLLPSLMEFLGSNTHVEYPQRIYEVGDCTVWDSSSLNRTRDIRKLASVVTHSNANFTEMKSYLEPLMANLGLSFTLNPMSHPSFLDGRVGSIQIEEREVGIIGEIHPQVIENWKLEDPVAAMELDLNQIFKLRR